MSLAREIEETNDLLRVGLGQLGLLTDTMREALAPKPLGRRSEAIPAGALMFIPTFSALRESLVDVPPAYFQRDEDGATIACRCRRALTVAEHSFMECGCGRLFCVTRRSVKVLPLEA